MVGTDTVTTKKVVENGRGKNYTLDNNGFTLVQHKIEHLDYFNEDEIHEKYFNQAVELVKEQTGAYKVFVFDHICSSFTSITRVRSERQYPCGRSRCNSPWRLCNGRCS